MKSPDYCSCPINTLALVSGQAHSGSRLHRQRGVALITVLLIVFLASVAAVSLASLQQLAIRRSAVFLHQQQARLYTLGAEQMAIIILTRDRQKNDIDHPHEAWALLPPILPVAGGTLTARISDLQGGFNLNNLWRPAPGAPVRPAAKPDTQPSDPKPADETRKTPAPTVATTAKAALEPAQLSVLQRLLESLALPPELALAIADWIDPDAEPRFPDGAEDSDYAVLNPAYLAANRPFVSVSELRLVKGVDQEAFAQLQPVVRALPPGTPVNINTAPALVLAALGKDGPKLADVSHLLQERPGDGYQSVDAFLNAAKLTTVEAPIKALLSVNSQYFLLQAEARVGDGRAMLYSMLYRDPNGVRVLQRAFGSLD